jgi:hypothetical protein
MSKRTDFDEVIQSLERLRDEIRVKIHLAAADARDEWEELEKKWSHLRGKAGAIGRVAGDAAEDVGEAVDLLGKELRRGYERLRKMV